MELVNFVKSEVKGHTRRYKGKTYQVRSHSRKKKKGKLLKGLGITAGVGLGSIALLKGRKAIAQQQYKKVLKNVGENLRPDPKLIKLLPEMKTDTMNFLVTGLTGDPKYIKNATKSVVKRLPGDVYVFNTSKYNPGNIKDSLMTYRLYMGQPKPHKEVLDLANVLLAYKTKYPGAKINVLGHSHGSTVVNEAMTILDNSKFKDHNIKAATFGAVNAGRTFLNDNVKNIVSKRDNTARILSPSVQKEMPTKYKVRKQIPWTDRGHDILHYWMNWEKDVKRHFAGG